MKKLITILFMFVAYCGFSQTDTTWKLLYHGNKTTFEYKIEKNLFCIKIDDNIDIPTDKKLMLSTDDGYINLEYKSIIKTDNYVIVKYIIIEKSKLSKYVISDIILNSKNRTYYMKIDTLTSIKINKDIK